MPQFDSYQAFNEFHQEVHSDPWNKRIHLAGWIVGGLILLVYPSAKNWWLFPLAFAAAFAISVLGHLLIQPKEKLVLNYPLWTLRADIEMFFAMAKSVLAKKR